MSDTPPALPLMVAAELQDHLLTASHDLERLQRLLADAGGTLLGHFHTASEELRALPQTPGDGAREMLERTLGSAVTALQFQDLADQLIVHTTRRLRNCADRLANDTFNDDEDGEAVVEALPARPNPVTQDEMDAGSIELF